MSTGRQGPELTDLVEHVAGLVIQEGARCEPKAKLKRSFSSIA